MSESENDEEMEGDFNECERYKKTNFNFQVSGWENDNDGIEEDKNPHENPTKEILWAAENGDIDLLKNLLAADPTLVDVKDKDNYTPLHRACYNNHYEIVEFLLQNGASHTARTVDNWQPLHSSCKWNSLESAALLISYGADINAVSNGGVTPLHLAAGHCEAQPLIKLLLSNPEVNFSLKDSTGDTAMDIARRCGPHESLFEITQDCFL